MYQFPYSWVIDPGHGWLKVPVTHVCPQEMKISSYSFYDDNWAYLEEDSDAGKFLRYYNIVDEARTYPVKHVERFSRNKNRY